MNRLAWRVVGAMLLIVAVALVAVPVAQRVADWRTFAKLPADFHERLQLEMRPPRPPQGYSYDAGNKDEAFLELENRRLFALFSEQRRARDNAVVIGLAVAVAIALLMAAMLARSLSKPIESVSATVKRLAAGDRSVRVTDSVASWPREAQQLANDFNSLGEALERYEGMRQALLADTAHELRNPLAALRLRIDALRDGIVQPSEEELAALHGNVELLTRLVHDLRLLSLAESKHLAIETQEVELAELIVDTVNMYRSAELHRVELAITEDPVVVLGDPARLQQVIINLLENAFAATPDGGVVVVELGVRDGKAVISVSDEGHGFEPDELVTVFERFVQGKRIDSATSSGLGLAIIKAIVQLHGGSVAAANRLTVGARGAVLTVELPLHTA